MDKKYNKLVRDKIPEIIKRQGDLPKVEVLDDDKYFDSLNQKLTEEVAEYLENFDINELADVLEVICAIVKYRGLSFNDLEKIRHEKFNERGGFDDKLFLIEVKYK